MSLWITFLKLVIPVGLGGPGGPGDPCDPCGPGLRGQVGQGDSEYIWFSWSKVVCSGVFLNHNLPKSCRNCNLQFKRCLEPQYAKKWFEGQFVKSREK